MDPSLARGKARSALRALTREDDVVDAFLESALPLAKRYLEGRKARPEDVAAAGRRFRAVLDGMDGVYMTSAYAGEGRKASSTHVSSTRAIVMTRGKVALKRAGRSMVEEVFDLSAWQARFDRKRAILGKRTALLQISAHALRQFLARGSGGTDDFFRALEPLVAMTPAMTAALVACDRTPFVAPAAGGLLFGLRLPITAGEGFRPVSKTCIGPDGVTRMPCSHPLMDGFGHMLSIRTFVDDDAMTDGQARLRDALHAAWTADAEALTRLAGVIYFEELDPPVGRTAHEVEFVAKVRAAAGYARFKDVVASELWSSTVRAPRESALGDMLLLTKSTPADVAGQINR